MPKLEIRNGKAGGKVVDLSASSAAGSTITLGNRRNATVELKDAWVSFNHAQITRQGDRYFIADAHSRSGTFVNDRRVDRTLVRLGAWDRILLGKTEIMVLADTAGTAATAPGSPGTAPIPAPLPAVPVSLPADTARIESLERELRQATGDLKNLREHVIAREKELSATHQKLTGFQAVAMKQIEELKAAARQRLDEVGRYAKQLEARLQQQGAGPEDASQLIEPGGAGGAELPHAEMEREVARLHEELARVKGEAQKRLLDAAERFQKEAGSSDELEAERKRADDLEREAGILRSRVEDIESEKKKLEGEVKSVRSEIAAYEQALEERNKDVERLESLVGGAAPASAPADSADAVKLQAELTAERKRAADMEKLIVDLRTQVEEINQDMLEQEDELREEISALDKQVNQLKLNQRGPVEGSAGQVG